MTVTPSGQAKRFFSACKDCGDISQWRRNGNKNSNLKAGTLCCCVRPRGSHPLRHASKTESVIASYLSSVKIFVVSWSAGEGDDAAGRDKIGRWQRDCSCLGDRNLQARKTPTFASETWKSQKSNAMRNLLCIPGICRSCFFPRESFQEVFQKHRWGVKPSPTEFYFFF